MCTCQILSIWFFEQIPRFTLRLHIHLCPSYGATVKKSSVS